MVVYYLKMSVISNFCCTNYFMETVDLLFLVFKYLIVWSCTSPPTDWGERGDVTVSYKIGLKKIKFNVLFILLTQE